MMMSDICSVNGINSQKPLPQASITSGKVEGVNTTPAPTTMTVATSAKMNASGTHFSVHAVMEIAMRASKPACGASSVRGAGFIGEEFWPQIYTDETQMGRGGLGGSL